MKEDKRYILSVLLVIFFGTIVMLLSSCASYTPDIKPLSANTNDAYFSNLYPHQDSPFETTSFMGYFKDADNRIYTVSVEFTKLTMEKNTFWFAEAVVYDYTNAKSYTMQVSSVNPRTPLSVSLNRLSLGSTEMTWSNDGFSIAINQGSSSLNIKTDLSAYADKFSSMNPKGPIAIQDIPISFFTTPVMNATGTFTGKTDEKKDIKAQFKGKGLVYKGFGASFLNSYEITFIHNKAETLFGIILEIPRENLVYQVTVDLTKGSPFKFQQIANPEPYIYQDVVKDRNRKYVINFIMQFDSLRLFFKALQANTYFSYFMHDFWLGYSDVNDKDGNRYGSALSYIYEYSRQKF